MGSSFFSELVGSLEKKMLCRVAVPLAEDEACAFAICEGIRQGLLEALLIGNPAKIHALYGDIATNKAVTIIPEEDDKKACQRAIAAVRENRADIIMKGLVATSTLLKAVLNTRDGLKRNPLLSHLTFFEMKNKPGLKIVTDVALNIAPDVDTLIGEVQNAVEAFRLFYDRVPKVALLAANEKVSEKVPATVLARDTAEKLKDRDDMLVEGPLALDLAISPESADVKKYSGRIRGDADLLVVPRIEAGNALYKSLQYFIDCAMGGLVYGARCPVVLTSRADDNDTKFYSLMMGVALWQRGNVHGHAANHSGEVRQ